MRILMLAFTALVLLSPTVSAREFYLDDGYLVWDHFVLNRRPPQTSARIAQTSEWQDNLGRTHTYAWSEVYTRPSQTFPGRSINAILVGTFSPGSLPIGSQYQSAVMEVACYSGRGGIFFRVPHIVESPGYNFEYAIGAGTFIRQNTRSYGTHGVSVNFVPDGAGCARPADLTLCRPLTEIQGQPSFAMRYTAFHFDTHWRPVARVNLRHPRVAALLRRCGF